MSLGIILSIFFVIAVTLFIVWTIRACVSIYMPLSRTIVSSELQRRRPEFDGVRQVPVYTIGSDPRCNDTTSNFTDYFWNVSSQNTRANEPTKDDKDLPSYEDIMRMEMARQVIDSAVQAPITTTTIHTVETSQPPPPPATSPPVRLPV
ncbi:uncharacterized protein LOC129951000 isoform X1 [Eupeodes corollae]|uniref:uncharacterized protein LOC129951000 isoform X1 n=1 Tax=Eupeodes corollae TaxID=290404 RepID=UPI002490ED29|nr:uncharacterized protein LOC129951000 isoform X1 [Eupeodes corollae]